MCENIKDYDDYLDREVLICQYISPELEELARNLIHLTAFYTGNGRISYQYDTTIIAVRALINVCLSIYHQYDSHILPLDIDYYHKRDEFEIVWITQDFNISLTIRDSPYYPNISLYVSNGVFKKDATYNDPDDIDIDFI